MMHCTFMLDDVFNEESGSFVYVDVELGRRVVPSNETCQDDM